MLMLPRAQILEAVKGTQGQHPLLLFEQTCCMCAKIHVWYPTMAASHGSTSLPTINSAEMS
jgi:hypothetical protein